MTLYILACIISVIVVVVVIVFALLSSNSISKPESAAGVTALCPLQNSEDSERLGTPTIDEYPTSTDARDMSEGVSKVVDGRRTLRRYAFWGILAIVVVLLYVGTVFVLLNRQKYAVREGTITGVVAFSKFSIGGTHAIYLWDLEGYKYRLRGATNAEAHALITSAHKDDLMTVAGRYWRPRTRGTMIVGGGRADKGPEMTDDPTDRLLGADFVVMVERVIDLTRATPLSEEERRLLEAYRR